MKKKGFTLIELLAAVVILGILSILAITSITRLISKSRDVEDNQYEKTLLMAAESYMQDNKSKLPKRVGEQKVLTATFLRQKRYLKSGDKGCVDVYKETNTDYKYTVDMECKGTETNICDKTLPEVEKIYFTDHTLEPLNNIDLDNISEARFVAQINGGKDENNKALKISGYSYAILIQTVDDPKLHEVYNTGTLNGQSKEKIKIIKNIKNYIDVTGVTNVSVVVTVVNELGCQTVSEKDGKYLDEDNPTCDKITGAAKNENDWINKKSGDSRVISVSCEDGKGSGCVRSNFARTWPNDYQKDAEWAYIEVLDNAGRSSITDESFIKGNSLCGITSYGNSCRVRVNVDKTLPTIHVKGAYQRKAGTGMVKENNNNILAIGSNKSITIDDKTASGTISANNYNNLINEWMNLAYYPNGVVFEIELSDSIHLDSWSWQTNKENIRKTSDNAYKVYGKNADSDSKSYGEAVGNCGTLNDTILIGFEKEGRRSGKLTVKDKAGNITTLIISANLDRVAPAKPTITYKKAKTLKDYTPGTEVKNWSTELINSYVTATVGGDISGWNRFEYSYRKQISANSSESAVAGSLSTPITGSVTKAITDSENTINGLLGYKVADEGRHTLKYRSCDTASNCSAYTNDDTIKVDTLPPACSTKISYSSGASLSNGWLGLVNGVGAGKETATVTQVCTENGNFPSGCDNSSISHKLYDTDIATNKAGAEGNGVGGSIKDIAGNVNSDCPANQKVYIDYQIPNCKTTGESTSFSKKREILRTCEDPVEPTSKVASGCTTSSTTSFVFAGAGSTFNLNDKVVRARTFDAYNIFDKAGNTRKCPSDNRNVFVDRKAPNCSFKVTNQYSSSGVTIKYTCDDKYGNIVGVGVKQCPGGKSTSTNTVNKKKETQKEKAIDILGNDMTCKVVVKSQKWYRKRTRTSYQSCSTSYSNCAWRGGSNYTNATIGECSGKGKCTASKRGTVCGSQNATYGWTCTCNSKQTCVTKYNPWSKWSSWSASNHCKNKKETKKCDQESKTVYYSP